MDASPLSARDRPLNLRATMGRRWIDGVRFRAVLAAAIGGLLWANPATAAPASVTYEYFVHHEIHGLIGRHRMTMTSEGDALTIEHRLRIAVKFLFTVVYRREAVYRETWRNGRLVAFEALVDDAGDRSEVRARAEEDRLMIRTPEGTIMAPPDAAPAQPSLEDAVQAGWFIEAETGRVMRGEVGPPVREDVLIGGEPVPATRYRVDGLDHDVWYDRTGVFLKMQLERGGGTVTMMRDHPAG